MSDALTITSSDMIMCGSCGALLSDDQAYDHKCDPKRKPHQFMQADKAQLDRLEEKLDRLLAKSRPLSDMTKEEFTQMVQVSA